MRIFSLKMYQNAIRVTMTFDAITGLPYTAIPVGKWVEFLRFIFFRVGKSLACHFPGKWFLCA